MKRIVILGSTGSVGTQTLDVVRWRGYKVAGLAAGNNAALLLEQAREFKPAAVSCHPEAAAQMRAHLPARTRLLTGLEGACEVARLKADVVVAAISGIHGLTPTLAALRQGRQVALANKEAMVAAGPLVWEVANEHGASIIPVDSEHSALFQCLVGEPAKGVDGVVLTASGGPFRLEPQDLSRVTPEEALKHPNWSMGSKVTVDSATLFNKGLEVLEAHFLFNLPLDKIEVVIHPQSLVHGLVRFKDGSLKAQIGPHDMRLPIGYGIDYPERPGLPLEPLPLTGSWEFHPPDHARFPALGLAYEAGRRGGVAPAALNAADEVAVAAFLAGRIGFMDIPRVLEGVLASTANQPLSWQSLAEVDAEARRLAASLAAWTQR
ncbi:MAG: 1-deoxy-D-xylulose-5-phosphate reductoisomerase [Deinococcota bacterium]|nr:1-deoxy-D-xylulose-5-phosphate reductoisomerase [Deinococcota bacterium]